MPTRLGVLEDAQFVMTHARHVAIDPVVVDRVGADFARREVPVPAWDDRRHFTDGTPRTANYLLLLDGLNFSFWGEPRWGISYRGEELRGYWALAAALKRAIEEGFPVDSAEWMAGCTEAELAHVLRGRGEIPLLAQRVAHANELGARLLESYDGQFVRAIERCAGSAVALVELLVNDFPSFRDASVYDGRVVRLLKRAQILPADLYGAFGGASWGRFGDIRELTAFADYKVPQVLEKLGLLRYSPALMGKLDRREEIPHQAPEEVELRAATIWGTELLRQAMAGHGREVAAIQVDWILWEMGLHVGPEDRPYHLTRTTAY